MYTDDGVKVETYWLGKDVDDETYIEREYNKSILSNITQDKVPYCLVGILVIIGIIAMLTGILTLV